MSEHQQALKERAWDEVLSPLFASGAPDRYVVLDDALTPAALERLQSLERLTGKATIHEF